MASRTFSSSVLVLWTALCSTAQTAEHDAKSTGFDFHISAEAYHRGHHGFLSRGGRQEMRSARPQAGHYSSSANRGAGGYSDFGDLVTCPAGTYRRANASSAGSAEALLRRHYAGLLRRGHQLLGLGTHALRRAERRGFVTYESPTWPRPPTCLLPTEERRKRVVDEPPGTCEPDGITCDKYRISRDYKFIWRHAWKSGTTSLSPYLSCNMRALPVSALLRRLPARPPGYLQVGVVREPLGRFLSGFQEVYARALVKPAGSRCPHRHVPWIKVATEGLGGGCAAAETPPSQAFVALVFRQFVSDVSCSLAFPNAQHMLSQSLFLGGNTSTPQPIDMLLRLETLHDDIEAFKKAVGYDQEEVCPLGRERIEGDKPRAVPTKRQLRQLVDENPRLLQAICDILIQDYVCLGYELPNGCELQT